MDYYQEFVVRARGQDAGGIIKIFEEMCRLRPARYRFLTEASAQYRDHLGVEACMLSRIDVLDSADFAWASSDGASLYLANIVPHHESLDSQRYNELAQELVADLKAFSRQHRAGITVRSSGADPSLEVIIPGAKVRQFFERYLGVYPRSYHPNDIERLDVFICAVSRYGRNKIDIAMLQSYLVRVLRWSERDAEWCCGRISIGLEILRVRRRF